MGWLRTNALILALGALVILMGLQWRDARQEVRALKDRIEQVINAEARADQARADLRMIEVEAETILETLEGRDDVPLPDDIRAAFERLRQLGTAPAR